jgi:hypothetical protein
MPPAVRHPHAAVPSGRDGCPAMRALGPASLRSHRATSSAALLLDVSPPEANAAVARTISRGVGIVKTGQYKPMRGLGLVRGRKSLISRCGAVPLWNPTPWPSRDPISCHRRCCNRRRRKRHRPCLLSGVSRQRSDIDLLRNLDGRSLVSSPINGLALPMAAAPSRKTD